MTFASINSESAQPTTLDKQRQQLKQWMQLCRTGTLNLFEGIDDETFCRQAHPDFSPVGWHLGHIAYTESLWLLVRCADKSPPSPLLSRRGQEENQGFNPSLTKQGKGGYAEYNRLFAADGLPKGERVYLPTLSEIRCYLDTVREQVFDYLEVAPLDEQERLWRWLIQHESQHGETISFLLQLQRWNAGTKELRQGDKQRNSLAVAPSSNLQSSIPIHEMVEIPAGEFEMGNDSIDALDNERPVHRVFLDTYWIDRYPVTCGQYRAFMEAGGYQNPSWWSAAGWQWLQANPVCQPLYWYGDSAWDDRPVCGVSCYEAEAYAQFVGKRLPTEAEWEKAASWHPTGGCRRTYPWGEAEPSANLCNHYHVEIQDAKLLQTTPVNAYPNGQSAYGCYDMLGNVWEWTASWFDGYDGFVAYPYAGYSKVYFDGQHRVLRGGSWATRPWGLRSSFRNWYHPWVRQILAGFRCARSVSPFAHHNY